MPVRIETWPARFPSYSADASRVEPCFPALRRRRDVNLIRTAMLLAFMTALFMGVGYLIGGSGGMMIAFLIAAGMNLFSYWNADKMVLRMHHAVEVDERTAPEYYGIVRDLAARAGLPMPKTYLIDNPQPNAFATGRNPQNAAVAATTGLLERLILRGSRGRHGARARPCAEPRHADHDHHRDACRRDLHARQFRLLLRRQPRQQQRLRHRRRAGRDDRRAARRHAWCRWRSAGRANIRPTGAAPRSAATRSGWPRRLTRSPATPQRIHNPDAERNPATAHMFIINPLSGERMDNLFSTHPATENRIAAPAGDGRAKAVARSAVRAPDRRARRAARGIMPAQPEQPAEPEAPKPNPWGRNPTGPRGRWS